MFPINNAILLGGFNATSLMKNSIVMHPSVNFLRKKFGAIIGLNGLCWREKYSSIGEVNSINFRIKLTIDLIKKMS